MNKLPRICVPIIDKDGKEIVRKIEEVKEKAIDLIELRADGFEDFKDPDALVELLRNISSVYDGDLIFTIRTEGENNVELDSKSYLGLNKLAIESGLVDMVDLEMHFGQDLKEIIGLAKKEGVKVIVSSHDFEKTEEVEAIIKRVEEMKTLDPDMLKIAQMVNTEKDILNLFTASIKIDEDYESEFAVVGMGELGILTRVSAGIYGSSMTYAAYEEETAPGQISIDDMMKFLDIIK